MLYEVITEAAGAVVTKIAFPELPMALKQGVVDGQENPLAVINSLKLWETQPYLALTQHSYNSMTAVISKKAWNKLTKPQQMIVQEEAQKAGQWFRDKNLEAEKGLVAELKSKGMQVTQPDLAAFKAKMQPAYDQIVITSYSIHYTKLYEGRTPDRGTALPEDSSGGWSRHSGSAGLSPLPR